MFHVKQPSLNINFDSLFSSSQGKELYIKNFPLDCLAPMFTSCINPVVVVVEDKSFELAIKYLDLLDEKIPPLIPPTTNDSKEPDFLDSSNKSLINKAREILSYGIKNIDFLFCSKSGLHMPIVGSNTNKPLSLHSKLTFESCLNFLQSNEYSPSEMVFAKGEYSVRGGIIDFFPRSRENPLRLSFLGENLTIHSFDIDSQQTIGPVSGECSIPSIKPDSLLPLYSFLKTKYNCIYINCVNKNLTENYLDFLKLFSVFRFENAQKKTFKKTLPHSFLYSSCVVGDENTLFVPSRFFNKKIILPKNTSKTTPTQLNLSTIKKGDFLVHRDHGVGRFLGLCLKDLVGDGGEYVLLEYGHGEKIKIDTSRLDLITFFASKNSKNITLDSLSKKNIWKRKRSAAQKSAQETVEKLLNLYVKRVEVSRSPLVRQGKCELDFLKDFPFTPTADQTMAWEEISQDMSSNTPMDRLLCGDVGFGKTELAMRAAFRCVLCNMRVVVLAPTTLLASQLYTSFKNRLSPHGANIDLLSRFRSKKDVISIKNNILNKKNDVLIGTHALLSDEAYLDNLGLLIIDEEHRFGVSQKEKIKHCKNNVDVLSMSATPIPRSMNLAISGIYSISLLQTPPLLRLPIKTYIKTFNDTTLVDAITFEVDRGGQVFCVNDDVRSINALSDRLRRLLPTLVIKVLHGQESAKTIENNMKLFLAKKISVLVCTSIIEAGIDVPNANCIIINNAHMFGLAQLYQMRGRVGRSNKQAYAYLLLPRSYKPSTKSIDRLNAIKTNSKLGSGLSVSQADLEIRGGGSLFGYKQSGGGSSVGYEMYIKLIQRALHSTKSLNTNFKILPEDVIIKIYSNAHIPENYINSENLRLSTYKDFLSTSSEKDLNMFINNIVDRFGPLPYSFLNLTHECRLKILCSKAGFSSITKQGCGFLLNHAFSGADNNMSSLIDFIDDFFSKQDVKFHFIPKQNLSFCIHFNQGSDKHLLLSDFLNKFILLN